MLDECWTSRPNWAWESQLGLAVRMQDAGVSGAGGKVWVIVQMPARYINIKIGITFK